MNAPERFAVYRTERKRYRPGAAKTQFFRAEFINWNRCRKSVSNFVLGIRGINEIRRQFIHIQENLPLSD